MEKSTDYAVVYIITQLELGGAQKVCLSLFEGLRTAHIPSFLISGVEGVLVPAVRGTEGVSLLPSFKHAVGVWTIYHEIKNFFIITRLLRALQKKHPHLIVHTHSTKAGIVGRWAAFVARVPYRVHTVHGFAFHKHQSLISWSLVLAVEWLTSWITTQFICVSSADTQTGAGYFPFFKRKSIIIRAAVDDTLFLPAQVCAPFLLPETFVFGTIACFKPQKNIFDLLRAFALVHEKKKNSRLEIIGDGQLRPRIEEWIVENKLQQAIVLHGWQRDVQKSMVHWHAFVLSSLWEGLPCALVEARLLKLPVISYDTGGITDIIYHGRNGFIIPQKKWRELANAMYELSTKEQLHAQLRQYPDQLDDFSTQNMVMQHAQLYENIVQGGK